MIHQLSSCVDTESELRTIHKEAEQVESLVKILIAFSKPIDFTHQLSIHLLVLLQLRLQFFRLFFLLSESSF